MAIVIRKWGKKLWEDLGHCLKDWAVPCLIDISFLVWVNVEKFT